MEGAGRGPAGLDVGVIESIEHGPEDIALGAEGVVGSVLLFARARMFDNPGESELGIFGRLGEACGEIVEARGEPRIELAEFFHTEGDKAPGEKFGERRSNGFDVGAGGNELYVGVYGVAGSREDAVAVNGAHAGQTCGFYELEPLFNSTWT